MDRRDDGTINMRSLDPKLTEVLVDDARRQNARSLSKGQRKQQARDAKRNRRSIDLSPDLEAHLSQIADELMVPFSQVVSYLLLKGLDHTTLEEMQDQRTPSRSMRYEYNLAIPKMARPP